MCCHADDVPSEVISLIAIWKNEKLQKLPSPMRVGGSLKLHSFDVSDVS